MENPNSGTKYYMTSEFQDILVAEKYRDQNSILGGGSKWFEPSMNLLDSAKQMYGYTAAYSLGDEGNKQSVKERAQRLEQPGSDVNALDMRVLATALEDPDPENGIFERGLITGDPRLAKVARERGVKVITPEDFLKQGKEQRLLSKDAVELMKKSTKDHQKRFDKLPLHSFNPDTALESEKQHIMAERRQRRKMALRPHEIQDVQQQITDSEAPKRERRKGMSKPNPNLGGGGLG